MVLLGEDVAVTFIATWRSDVQRLTQRIVDWKKSTEMGCRCSKNISRLWNQQGHLSDGGPDYARKLLVKAFGEENESVFWSR